MPIRFDFNFFSPQKFNGRVHNFACPLHLSLRFDILCDSTFQVKISLKKPLLTVSPPPNVADMTHAPQTLTTFL